MVSTEHIFIRYSKGERKVPSVDFVENISLQLMLSTEDKSRLMELYNISEMGKMSTIAVSRCQR